MTVEEVPSVTEENIDVLIVGAGLSGISSAYHLQKYCPTKSFVILEARKSMGGTWDLFRYPGVRSDSDMFTLGYSFKPWPGKKSIADGGTILQYIKDTASENNIDKYVRYQQKATKASWSSEDDRWTIEAELPDGGKKIYTANFIMSCTGYYSYEEGFTPTFKGLEAFKGKIIHPQFWPEGFDYSGKKVVVIGSGATAITVVPAMADKAKHVTMLQRSPTYVASQPAEDKLANMLRVMLPERLAYKITRWRKIIFMASFYRLSKKRPKFVKKLLVGMVRRELGKDYDIKKHFTPTYNPWDERLCAITDSDLFRRIKDGSVSVVTDHIDTFTENGITLRSGEHIDADIVITATGLVLKTAGDAKVVIDGKQIEPHMFMSYKGVMFSDVPNLSMVIGYTNASWTLKADLISYYVCRLINYMDKHNFSYCAPRRNDPTLKEEPFMDFQSGYIQRSLHLLPKRGDKGPWKLCQNYFLDTISLKYSSLKDDSMAFYKAGELYKGIEADA